MSSKYFIFLQQSITLPLIQTLIYSNGKDDSGHSFWKIYRHKMGIWFEQLFSLKQLTWKRNKPLRFLAQAEVRVLLLPKVLPEALTGKTSKASVGYFKRILGC